MVAPGTLRWGPGDTTSWSTTHRDVTGNLTDSAATNTTAFIIGAVTSGNRTGRRMEEEVEDDWPYLPTLLVDNITGLVSLWSANVTNSTWNSTLDSGDVAGSSVTETVFMAVTSVVLGVIILATVIGNVFVIAAILLERHLQNVANYLILSLAVADLMVACLVMPLGAVYEVSQRWILGPELCDMWTSSDVLCCTASILHLVAIAVDRYWAVTNVDYIHHRNSQRIGLMILAVWVVSFVVSLAPIFGWKDSEFQERVNVHKRCLVSQDIAYQVFATLATFYVPLIIILVLYWRIYQTARKRIRRKVGNAPPAPSVSTCEAADITAANTKTNSRTAYHQQKDAPTSSSSEATTAFTTAASGEGGTTNVSPEKSSSANGSTSQTSHMSDMSRMDILPKKERKGARESAESKRERKAAKTLAIITGAFVFCWLPFFVAALVLPVCGDPCLNDVAMSFFLWLGYFNSTLNPIIYTIFSPEFRSAFKRILFGRRRRGRYRPKR